MKRAISLLIVLGSLPGSAAADRWEHEWQWRGKLYGAGAALPAADLQRAFGSGTPAWDGSADSRIIWQARRSRLRLDVHHSLTLVGGDSLANADARTALDASGPAGNLWWDLGSEIDAGAKHRLTQGLDRLLLEWQPNDDWRIAGGRGAISWGSGRVFQPADLFSPFAPTLVDRDYKPGSDMLLLERSLSGGGSLQLLAVGRSAADRQSLRGQRSSLAMKWHGLTDQVEWELFGGRHFDEAVFGGSLRVPLGGALLQADITLIDSAEEGRVVNAVVNADYAWSVAERPLYLFAEWYPQRLRRKAAARWHRRAANRTRRTAGAWRVVHAHAALRCAGHEL